MITVFADQYLYEISSFLPDSVDLRLYDPAHGLPDNLDEAQGLLIRTVNAINPQTLPEIPETLSFIGTGSAGTDHVDQTYLQDQGITFVNAAGCNARSVAEYVATVLLLWSEQLQKPLHELSVGIVGVGHAGSQVHQQLEKLQVQTVCYDPPRQERDPSFQSSSLEEVLFCDILTFHTPLVSDGDWATYHWLDDQKLADHSFQLIINAARGGVIDEEAIIKKHKEGTVKSFILDVWEDEPNVRLSTANQTFLETPHIAGYSIQAKQNASKFIAEPLIDHFNLSPAPSKKKRTFRKVDQPVENFENLVELLSELHPVKEYESRFKDILANHPQQRGRLFNRLRAEFPLRQQFSSTHLPKTYFERFPVLAKLGFGLRSQAE